MGDLANASRSRSFGGMESSNNLVNWRAWTRRDPPQSLVGPKQVLIELTIQNEELWTRFAIAIGIGDSLSSYPAKARWGDDDESRLQSIEYR